MSVWGGAVSGGRGGGIGHAAASGRGQVGAVSQAWSVGQTEQLPRLTSLRTLGFTMKYLQGLGLRLGLAVGCVM